MNTLIDDDYESAMVPGALATPSAIHSDGLAAGANGSELPESFFDDVDLTAEPPAAAAAEAPATKKRPRSEEQEAAEESDDASKRRRRRSAKSGQKKEERRKQKTRRAVSAFIDDAAEEDEEDEEDDEESHESLTAEDRAELAVDTSYIKQHKQKRHFLREDEGDMDAEALAKSIEERYKASAAVEAQRKQLETMASQATKGMMLANRVQRGLGAGAAFAAHALQTASDPKVFAVKVRPGFARILVARIVNKCHAYLHGLNHAKTRQDLGIISVFSVDHVKEWIYIESHRQRFVDNALTGLEHVFRFRTTQVDPSELTKLLRPREATEAVTVGQLVRVKISSLYKDDLCQVVQVLEDGKRIVVKLVPREDFVGKQWVKKRFTKGMLQPPARFFVASQAVNARVLEDGSANWGDHHFDAEGYLVKNYSARQLSFGSACPKPNLEELAFFFKKDPQRVEEVPQAALVATPHSFALKLHERVVVLRGQFVNCRGRICNLRAPVVEIEVKDPTTGGSVIIVESMGNVTRDFPLGTHVSVETGPSAGESGTVIGSDGARIVIVSDREARQVNVRGDECRISSMVSAGVHASHGWHLFDLVMLTNGTTVGCIVQISATSVRLVTLDGVEQTALISSIKQAIRTRAQSLDRFGNFITSNDAVCIYSRAGGGGGSGGDGSSGGGSGAGDQTIIGHGKIEHVFGDRLFVLVSAKAANAMGNAGSSSATGMKVIAAADVAQIGGKRSSREVLQRLAVRPYVEKPPHAVVGHRSAHASRLQSAAMSQAESTAPHA